MNLPKVLVWSLSIKTWFGKNWHVKSLNMSFTKNRSSPVFHKPIFSGTRFYDSVKTSPRHQTAPKERLIHREHGGQKSLNTLNRIVILWGKAKFWWSYFWVNQALPAEFSIHCITEMNSKFYKMTIRLPK